MNKAYLKSLAIYQCMNVSFYVILSGLMGTPMSLSGLLICVMLGVFVHKYFAYKNGN